MRVARFVRTLGVLLVLGLAGAGGGCGVGAQAPVDKEREDQIRESKKTAHRQLAEDAKRAQNEGKQQGAMQRKAAHRRPAGG
jgi:uncharacterized protein HemX